MALADLAFPGGWLSLTKILEQAIKRVNAWLSKATIDVDGKLVSAWVPPSDWLLNAWIQGCLPDPYMRQALKAEMLDPKGLSSDILRFTSMFQDMIKLRDPTNLGSNNGLAGFLLSQTKTPSIVEAFTLWNRELVDEGVVDFIIRKEGIADPNIASAIKNLRFEIPPNSDIIRWVVREAFNPVLIKKYGYFNEVPISARQFSKANGLGGPTGVIYPAGTDSEGKPLPAGEATWFDMEWVSHWDLPSTGQGYEMLHRLYPNSRYGPSPIVTPNTQFTANELADLLKTADVPPYWRERLMAISYSPLTRVDVRRMYQVGVLDKAGIYHAYRAIGYDDENANSLVNFTVKLTESKAVEKVQRKAVPKVCAAYQTGIITDVEFAKYLDDINLDPDEATEIVNQCKYDRHLKHVNAMIRTIKRQFVKGVISRDNTLKQLNALSIKPERVKEYMDEWSLELTVGKREATASQVLSWYKEGLIEATTAFDRLIHLGFDRSDATLMVGYATNELQAKRGKAAEAGRKEAEARAKKAAADALKQQKEIEKNAKSKIRQTVTGATEANLKKWLEEGDMTPLQVKAYLLLKGYTETLANKWIASVERHVGDKEKNGKTKEKADEIEELPG